MREDLRVLILMRWESAKERDVVFVEDAHGAIVLKVWGIVVVEVEASIAV